MSTKEYVPSIKIKERDFQRTVTDMATALGWKYHHEAHSFGSKPGWPDLSLFHPVHGALYLELKVGKYKVTEAQEDWLDFLNECGQPAYVVRPSDIEFIEALLKGEKTT